MNIATKREFKFYKAAIIIAFPVMLQQLVTALGTLVDNLMVGQLDAPAITAVAASNQMFMVIMCIGFGISEGIAIFTAQQFGARKYDKMHHTFCIGLILSVFFGILSMTIMAIFKTDFLHLFNLTVDGITHGESYLGIVLFSYMITLINITIATVFRSTSRTKPPMIAGIVAIIINTSINFLLINGNFGFPALGVGGAATATVISRIVELMLLIIFILYLKPEFVPKIKDFLTIPFDLFKNIVKKTIPLISNEFLWATGMSILAIFYATRGETAYAAVSITQAISQLLFVTLAGFAVATSIIIGQKLGGNKLNQARRDSARLLRLGIFVGIFVGIVAFVLSEIVPELYNVDQDIKDLASILLKIYGMFYIAFVIGSTIFFILRAGGDTIGVFIMDSMFMWVVQVPAAAAATFLTDIDIVYLYIFVLSFDIIKVLVGIYRFRQNKWVNNLNMKGA